MEGVEIRPFGFPMMSIYMFLILNLYNNISKASSSGGDKERSHKRVRAFKARFHRSMRSVLFH